MHECENVNGTKPVLAVLACHWKNASPDVSAVNGFCLRKGCYDFGFADRTSNWMEPILLDKISSVYCTV